ncbi:MAG: aminopeptidase P family protein, partial [Anaerolineaceae bacterium]|nr:aminopeptidase P family protein [Anaerolineaceae bacterium]
YKEIIEEAGGDPVVASAIRYSRMFADLGIQGGRVALYGKAELASAFPIFYELTRRMPEITLVGDVRGEILGRAMTTKDDAELDRIRKMARITTGVVGRTADYLTSRPVREEVLLAENGDPLTIGKVKGLINLWLAEAGAENPEGTIFAIGRDAGVPHSGGSPEDVITLGKSIVFDIFPCEAGGGYFYDFTRTWCLGYAPDEVQVVYDQVYTVYQTMMGRLEMGKPFKQFQLETCEMFEEMGHPTVLNTPDTEEGYVHSLGHGLGLKVHERPFSGASAPDADILEPGVVVSVEPGLYYPQRGFGVRLEDSVALHVDGTFEVLADYPLDLVLPMKG